MSTMQKRTAADVIYTIGRSTQLEYDVNQADRSGEYINRSQIHECRNWERGRAVSFLVEHINRIFVTVYSKKKNKMAANVPILNK
jgi:hypothetical protein